MSVLEIAKRMIYEIIENADDLDNFIWIMGENTKDKLTSETKKIYMSYDFPFYEVSKLYGIEIKDTLLDDPNGLCLISKNAYKQTKYEEINE